jgi:hypothetical protein
MTLANPSAETEPGGVQLVFPPLVESGFGSVYPAPAVLAGFLESHGIRCVQQDLNAAFAEYLLDPAVCATLGSGEFPGVPADSYSAAIARWAAANRGLLIDTGGRQNFGPDSRFGWAMELLAKPFAIDPGHEVLRPLDDASPAVTAYRDFYQYADACGAVGTDTALVGISAAMGPQLLPALVLAQRLKQTRPELRVVIGGPAVSLLSQTELGQLLRSHPAVDAAVRFDGEYPLLALARQALAGLWYPGDVPGVSVITTAGPVHVSPGLGPNLNKLPRPRYDKQILAKLASPRLSVTQARGCYWGKCDYCDFVELYDGSPPFRGRHPENFAEEVASLAAEFGVTQFAFVTESIPPAFARRLCTIFLTRGIKVSWNSFAMVDRRFDRELLGLMVEAGCEFLVIGLETMVTRVLKLVHKSADREENIRFLTEAHAAGMRLRINLIPDLPSTTYEEALSCLDDMEQLAHCVESISVFPFEATRSSNVGRSPEKFGLLPLAESDVAGQAQYALNHLHNSDPAMTPDQRREVHRRFQEFARRHSTKSAFSPPGTGVPFGRALRVPAEELDVLDDGERLVCTHMGTRQRLTLPAAALPLIRPHLSGAPFRAPVPREDQPDSAQLVRQLLSTRLLVPAASAGRSD